MSGGLTIHNQFAIKNTILITMKYSNFSVFLGAGILDLTDFYYAGQSIVHGFLQAYFAEFFGWGTKFQDFMLNSINAVIHGFCLKT